MSGHPKQPNPNRRDKRRDERRENTQKHTPAPSLQPSRSTTPVPSNRRGLSPGAIGILPSNSQSAPRGVDEREDSLKGGDAAQTDKSDTVQFIPVGQTYGSSTIINVHGGVGGLGGQGGKYGGHGGTGEGPTISVHNSNVYVTNPNASRLQSIEKKLTNHVAAQYKFTDQSKSLCAAGTRVEIQRKIMRWLSPEPSSRRRIFWITGIAGSGKSTLSATVVENLRKKGTPVAAQFFISRNIPETINPDKIIPTMAQQLAQFSPDAARIIHDKLKHDCPSSCKEQVEELLLAPIQELSKSHNVVVILIDALDELQNAARSVPEILSHIAAKGCNFPDNLRFLITSRPEHWADISRSKSLELALFKQHLLGTESSVDEVHNFIVSRMQEITPSDWDNWPTSEQLAELSGKANGLFHYAETALQWIKQQIAIYNRSCRSWVLDRLIQEGGLDQLQDLYKVILMSFEDINHAARNAERRANRLAAFQHVIGTILVLYKPLTIQQIIALLDDVQVEHLDVKYFLQQFRSVLIPGTTTSFEEATPQMHKSFS
ncbi:hypothetical protein MVEN_01743600 [Mycena venus]|uniref:NACHT domain-containing protein n=1 Tax=Mycena venus TaxID=2733690 RepID=A0A8H6XMH4_9AGAR|nr:hypothetical protein MVEN_01743600 [Mycena venus]